MDLEKYIRVIEGFPQEGISFKDVTTLLKDGEVFRYTINAMVDKLKNFNPDLIIGPEARGFIFGAPIAYELGIGLSINLK